MKTKSLSKNRRRPSPRSRRAGTKRKAAAARSGRAFRTGRAKGKKRGKPDPAVLANIIRQIVRAAKPEKVVLFGSAARGTMGPDSDYDLLVIKAGKFNHNRITTAIYRELSGEAAVDAVVVTPEEVERYRDSFCLVIYPALREGKVVYEA